MMECVRPKFLVESVATLLSASQDFDYSFPETLGLPWTQIRPSCQKDGLKHPVEEASFDFDGLVNT